MTATDELRAELTKRGVEYEVDDGKTVRVTRWKAYGEWVSFIEYDTGETRFCVDMRRFTPAQAIAATLGSDDTFTREDVESAFVSGYSLGLDMFDNSKPDNEKGWNQNERNLDDEMEDLGWVRKDAATLGAGTCRNAAPSYLDFLCSECGFVNYRNDENDSGSGNDWHHCPNCGRKVVDG
jgi:predicted RNA-binding Zn-ribbon protein involved in translation (DUF1610 family)